MGQYKKKLAGVLATVLLTQGTIPVMAKAPELTWNEKWKSRALFGKDGFADILATPYDAAVSSGSQLDKWMEKEADSSWTGKAPVEDEEKDQDVRDKKDQAVGEEKEEEESIATPSNGEKNIFADMPEIGSDSFTEWFLSHGEEEDLWNWMFGVLEGQEPELYEKFIRWYELWEETVTDAYHKFAGIETMAVNTDNLWNDWQSDMNFPGDGTKEAPFQIGSIQQLMGLSEIAALGSRETEGKYFELTRDLNLSGFSYNKGNWMPIGWYQKKGELGGAVQSPFRGHFDGRGNTISGLKIVSQSLGLTNIGLFGVIDGGSVKNLNVEADQIAGEDNGGILAGCITGDAIICGVTVSGYVNTKGNAGGIAGEVTGSEKRVTVENCSAESIVLNSEGTESFVGGIAGNVQNAWIVDSVVTTQNGDADRIRGKGYVGGIAGKINRADIYNAYVSGTIGGNGSRAVGGIIGRYQSGNLVLARMAGRISATNQGMAAREGTFIGTRESRDRFTYGTEKTNNVSYLFANDAAKAKNVIGSTIDGDNSFTKEAHIGYWTDHETKYALVFGNTETHSGERYFYEELEDGVRYIVTGKLNREFTASDYARGISFHMDHFAPGYMGQPVRGYLVSIPRIDARNDNGTFDTDVAKLTAISGTNNTYYRTIDKDHARAVVPGSVVTVATGPKNTGENRYQMVVDHRVPGGVKAPTFINGDGQTEEMDYVNGGSYSFIMPNRDTELNAEYIKVTTKLYVDPAKTSVHIVQTRSGDRKNPKIVTEVTNQEGVLIARYIDGNPDRLVEVQPIRIHGEHNGAGQIADRTMKWSIDDTNLLTNLSETGYTVKDAVILPNLSSNFIQGIIQREVQAQADNQYQEKINNTIYSQHAVVTAATNPETSIDNRPVYANCQVNVTFQIVDNTTVRVEGMSVSPDRMEFTVTRKLTGDRKNPKETLTASHPLVLTAALKPVRPFFKNVSWNDLESGKILSLTPSGDYTQDCKVEIKYDSKGQKNPAWIQNVIQADKDKKRAQPYEKLFGSGTCEESVTAASEDQTHGHIHTVCPVEIRFVTEDETVIHPEELTLNQENLAYKLSYDYTGTIYTKIKNKTGFGVRDTLVAKILPDLPKEERYEPYDRTILWHSSDPDVIKVENGRITVLDQGKWIQEALKTYPYKGEKVVTVTAEARDGGLKKSCKIHLTFQANALLGSSSGSSGSGSSGGGGKSSNKGNTGGSQAAGPGVQAAVTINETAVPKAALPEGGLPDYVVSGNWNQDEQGNWRFTDGFRNYVNEWAAVVNPYANVKEGQNRFDWFRFDEKGFLVSGWYHDLDGRLYYLNPVSDGTKGRMVTGWNWITDIDGITYRYYFNENSDGTKGALIQNGVALDGAVLDEKGRQVVDGKLQVR